MEWTSSMSSIHVDGFYDACKLTFNHPQTMTVVSRQLLCMRLGFSMERLKHQMLLHLLGRRFSIVRRLLMNEINLFTVNFYSL